MQRAGVAKRDTGWKGAPGPRFGNHSARFVDKRAFLAGPTAAVMSQWKLQLGGGARMATDPNRSESSMEARIAHLESDVTHLLSDMAEIKADVRSLRDRVDLGNVKSMERTDAAANRLDDKIDKVAIELNVKIDKVWNETDAKFQRVDDKIDQLGRSLAKAQVWAVLLYVALAGGMLGTMARGFGWL